MFQPQSPLPLESTSLVTVQETGLVLHCRPPTLVLRGPTALMPLPGPEDKQLAVSWPKFQPQSPLPRVDSTCSSRRDRFGSLPSLIRTRFEQHTAVVGASIGTTSFSGFHDKSSYQANASSFYLIHKGRIGGRDGGVGIASDLRLGLEGCATTSACIRVLVGILADFSEEEGLRETVWLP